MAAVSASDVSTRCSTWMRPTWMWGSGGRARCFAGRRLTAVGRGKRADQRRDLVRRHVAVDDDALDAEPLQPPHQIAHRPARAGQRHVADDELAADDAERERPLLADDEQRCVSKKAFVLRATSGWVGA